MHTETFKLIYILIAGTVLISSVFGYFIWSMVRLHRNHIRLTDQQNQDKITALEKERQLIAADLHDDIGPMLSATNFKLQELNPVTEREQTLLKEAIGHIDGVYSHLREVSSMLVPRFLETKGPLFAIEEFASQFCKDSKLNVQIIPVACKGLSPEKSLHIYRMLQEILNNTIKHAKAKHFTISGEVVDNKLIIHTSDDGIGFNPHTRDERRGLGLQNLELRARMIGVKLVTDTSPGKGTMYTLELLIKT